MKLPGRAIEIISAFKEGEISAREITEWTLERIKEWEPKINAYITITAAEALRQAELLDQKRKNNKPLGRLSALPVAIKDNIITKGIKTTCASRILSNYIPPYNATAVERLLQEDAIIVGKTNMDEFAMGSSTEHSAFGATRNPLDILRVAGGSSGGSAATVASLAVPVALGSDTGGSVRQPASFCGVVGFKPTYGRISRFGLVAFASSLDQIGVISKNVTDSALVYAVIAGYDPHDSTSINSPIESPFFPLDNIDLSRSRFAVPEEFLGEGINEEVRGIILNALSRLPGKIEKISLPVLSYAVPVYYIIAPAEMSSNLARYDGVRYGVRENSEDLIEMYELTRSRNFGDEVKRRIMIGTFVLSSGYYEAYFKKAAQARRIISNALLETLEKYDFILSPTTPTTAFRLGEKLADPLEMYLSDICTTVANFAGLPAISIPCGRNKNGLPVGLQIMGRPMDDRRLLSVANEIEKILSEG